MLITDRATGQSFEVTGSVKRVVQVNDCVSFVNADGVTQTVEFVEGSSDNGDFTLTEQ